jgi:fatty acid desaturase
VAFAIFAVLTGHWFLIVVVSLPGFYGARWYHTLVHDTMHVGRQPETDDFRASCRSVRLDPFTSFMYWHMEWHTEHHTYASIPCYRLKKFHRLTRQHWDPPQSLVQAWREMNAESAKFLALA